MTRPAWLEAVVGICGGELEDWREIGAHGGTWRWRDRDDTERKWSADSDSVWHEGSGLWVEARCCSGGEPDYARLARAVQAGLAVARGDLDVDALQQQVATLTRERAAFHAFLEAAAEPEAYPDDPRLFALSPEQERLITAYAARWRAECTAADKERAEIATRLALIRFAKDISAEDCGAPNRVTGRESAAQEAWDRQAELLDGADLPDLDTDGGGR